MRKILIVGAGQAGLQLALGLLQRGYDVTVVSDRTPDGIAAGKVMSSQCMFGTALQTERRLGVDLWSGICPAVDGIQLTVPGPDGGAALHWAARLEAPAQSVDQRVKIPRWMQMFEQCGGKLLIHDASAEDLEEYATDNDLVLVAAGKGGIASLFERDAEKSPYDKPQRALAVTYVTGLRPRPDYPAVCFNLVPGVGEHFVLPALTTTGPCEIMVFEGVPGGPMDCWADVTTPAGHLARSKEILDAFLPWEAERARGAALTDGNGVLTGRFAPTVRKPVGMLPSGRPVLGAADVVVLNDPITGQGSNNAARCAAIYLDAIVARGRESFDAAWMQQAFDRYWSYARHVTAWTNALLAPAPAHVLELLGAAQEYPAIASRFVNGFDNPPDFAEWFMDPGQAARYLAEVSTARSVG
jgi:Styrene monooxygenase A putative substrate binding domain